MPEIRDLLSAVSGKHILIIGNPMSGKTYLSRMFSKTGHTIIHTDDYIKYGHEEVLEKILNDIKKSNQTVVEGMYGYRLLRYGLRSNSYYPDIVIEIKNSKAKYSDDKVKKMEAFIKGNETILNEYKSMRNSRKPIWIVTNNDYA